MKLSNYPKKIIFFILLSSLIALFTTPVIGQSTVIATEDFESYSTGNLNGNNGGAGWGGSWSVNNSQQVVDASLSYSISGGSTIDGGDKAFAITTNNNKLFNRQLSSGVAETVYVRYLLRWASGTIDSNDFVATGVNETDQDYNQARVFGLKSNEGPSNQDFFLRPTSSFTNNFYTPDQLAPDTTYLVVMRYTKGTGNFNQMDLWVNPAYGDESSPEASASQDLSIDTINYFGARTANISGETVLIDEIIISTDWDDVVPSAPEIEFSGSTGSGNEASTSTPQLVLNYDGGTLSSDYIVTVSVTGGDADVADYSNITTVTIPSGTADGDTVDINFSTTDDSDVEGNETLEFTLSSPSDDMTLGTQTTFTYTITEDDTATVAFDTGSTTTLAEASAGIQSIDVSLIINGTTATAGTLQNGAVTAEVQLANTGTATNGTDITTFNTASLNFANGLGNTTETVDVIITDDAEVEGDETLDFILANVSANASAGTASHTVTITDDDTATFTFALAASDTDKENVAGNHAVDVTLTLTGTTAGTPSLKANATVDVVDTTTGTATALDYIFTDTTLTFSDAGTQSVDVTILDDTEKDKDETVIIGLSNPSANATIGTILLHTVTIKDNEGGSGSDDRGTLQNSPISSEVSSSSDTSESKFSDVLLKMSSSQGFIIDGQFTVQVFVNNNRGVTLTDVVVETTFSSGVEITNVNTTRGSADISTTTLMRPINRRHLNKNHIPRFASDLQSLVTTSLGDLQANQRAVITISGRVTSQFRGVAVNATSTIDFSGLESVETVTLQLPIINVLPQTGETPIWRTQLIMLFSLISLSLAGLMTWILRPQWILS